MSRTESNSVVVGQTPAWLAKVADKPVDTLEFVKEYRTLPRLQLIQSMHKREIKTALGEGSMALMPGALLISKFNNPIQFVPLLPYPEWIIWNDRNDTSQGKIMDRTLDHNSPIALRSKNPQQRVEKYFVGDKEYTRRWAEQIVVAGLIYGEDNPNAYAPCSMVFARSQFKIGRDWINGMSMRKFQGITAPCFTQVWVVNSTVQSDEKNEWFGWEVTNPVSLSPWIRDDDYSKLEQMHNELKDLYLAKRISVDMDDEIENTVDTAATATVLDDLNS